MCIQKYLVVREDGKANNKNNSPRRSIISPAINESRSLEMHCAAGEFQLDNFGQAISGGPISPR